MPTLTQPYRGDGSDRPRTIPLPPQRMPLFRMTTPAITGAIRIGIGAGVPATIR
ncbi:MAG: hypothetical protein H0X37_09860 [Herpetosiphonaceae bacterium]|nr:hypothetical protein [Herpetosiphonaceae bacterium]